MEDKQNKSNGLNKSLKLIFVYTVATGSIFTFVNYWDSVFYGYCGSGTFLAFALMTVAILPVALVYSELASLFHTSGGELIYNTVGINKHVGFLAYYGSVDFRSSGSGYGNYDLGKQNAGFKPWYLAHGGMCSCTLGSVFFNEYPECAVSGKGSGRYAVL